MSKGNSIAQSSGILMSGSGALRLQALQANLVSLSPEQLELVTRAKKYASEQTSNHIYTNQSLVTAPNQIQQSAQQPPQKTIQRYQALLLMCRVYVGSISFELKEESIKTAFSPFGAIKSVNMSWDPVTLKHKGFAFVEYELPEAAHLALERMNGIQLGGRQIKVGRPSNMPQAASVIPQNPENRIYISNVRSDWFDDDLIKIVEPFGRVKACRLAVDQTDSNQHRGYGFIEFDTKEAAIEALSLDKLDLKGQVLHVCPATTPSENISIHGTLESENSSHTPTNSNDDEDIRTQLERENGEQRELEHDTQTAFTDSGYANCANDKVSNILVLKNMISADEDLDDSLLLDVYEECCKHGSVSQVVIYLDKGAGSYEPRSNNHDEKTQDTNSDNGISGDHNNKKDEPIDHVKIFIKYRDSNGSRRAKEALDGRYFGGRRVSAEHYNPSLFRQRILSE